VSGIVVGQFRAKPRRLGAPQLRPVGLGKGDETAWRRAWGGTTNHGSCASSL
jgi:hypothetical protein